MTVTDCVVIGAGVVGLAIARALSMQGHETVVVEAERRIGGGVSSRNSEVIHAGLYYPQGSLKARLCVQGRRELYAYCAARSIPHRRCGKLIVATAEAQAPDLDQIKRHAAANGVDDLQELDAAAARRLEPALRCISALQSPSTGIIDSHAYMLALQGDLERYGGVVALGARVRALMRHGDLIALTFEGEDQPSLAARLVVNAAGLSAQALARTLPDRARASTPPIHYAKGSYFSLAGRSPFSRLIYPAPEPGGLGVHLTLDLAGQARFGPDVEWVETLDYAVDPGRAARFYAAIRAYWPGLPDDALAPAYAGIRPKLSAPGGPAADFRIDGPLHHGVPGLIELFGIESPGLTASLAIAGHVAAMAQGAL